MRATKHIHYWPDRVAIEAELKASYEDHRDGLIEAGETRDRASFLALQALGDPEEAGRLLRSIHQPLLTALWQVSRVLLVCILTVVSILAILQGRAQLSVLTRNPEEDILNDMAFYREMGENTWRREGHCDETASLEDYTFSVTRAMICQTKEADLAGNHSYYMVLILKEDGPFSLDAPPDLQYFLTAEDDQLNFYDSIWNKVDGYTPERSVKMQNVSARRWNSHYACLWIAPTEPDVQWIDLSYDHLGKSFVLRINFDEEASL
nr:hypothetical protein [Clostridia bacterium]